MLATVATSLEATAEITQIKARNAEMSFGEKISHINYLKEMCDAIFAEWQAELANVQSVARSEELEQAEYIVLANILQKRIPSCEELTVFLSDDDESIRLAAHKNLRCIMLRSFGSFRRVWEDYLIALTNPSKKV